MKLRPLVLLALLVITSGMPLVAAAGACTTMASCHAAPKGELLAAPMSCCEPEMTCAPEPVAQPEATTSDSNRLAAVIALGGDVLAETLAPRNPQALEPLDTSPPPPTRVRLARLATLLI